LVDEKPSEVAQQQAAMFNEAGLAHYADWEIDKAIDIFKTAVSHDPGNPEYHLNLARAHARGDSYPEAMRSLGEYLHYETDEQLTDRFERLFSTALDEVESAVIEGMSKMEMPVQIIGKAIQMWLEYRLTVGRRPLSVPQPNSWAAALAYAVCRINFLDIDRVEIAGLFDIELSAIKKTYDRLLKTLDLIPADYRYFVGEENPLDKVFEAAQLLNEKYGEIEDE
jgi:tetratricopeptide (TPR) repeat protein